MVAEMELLRPQLEFLTARLEQKTVEVDLLKEQQGRLQSEVTLLRQFHAGLAEHLEWVDVGTGP